MRSAHRGRSCRALAGAALIAALGWFALGCAEIRGARLYRDGTLALDRGDAEGAVAALEHAVEEVPLASEVQNHLGLAYLASERPADALLAFERAVALDCDNAAAQSNLRRIRARQLAR